ncbi:hypothetical protein EJ06DRAFT_477529 [Trichodelitschia bisporula]|uniref:TPR-like protein n=1 Tax=Trichodelitschia bisporula TaxID=703511 RepID=A0A6G1HV82_9PEZI|nr:hypothetical protein EJ06DRAFT_477529 [Trichodelitschia bisporula]
MTAAQIAARNRLTAAPKRIGKKARKRQQAEAEQSPEFARLNGLVTKAWLREDWDSAYKYALEAVKINPEVFPLHGTIAEILVKKGRFEDALGALFAGAHSAADAAAWWYVVDRFNEIGIDDRATKEKLGYCYSRILEMNPKDYAARVGRMKNHRALGHHVRSKNECFVLLKTEPYDTEVLIELAEITSTLKDTAAAVPVFEAYFENAMEGPPGLDPDMLWQLMSFFVDLLNQAKRYEEALFRLRSISRWLLGRAEETYWDEFPDDTEWDVEDQPRRIKVPQFIPGRYDPSLYGESLPVEMRERLGLIRLWMGPEHFEEAKFHLEFLHPEDLSNISYLYEYPELFREVGDALRESSHYTEALRFYEPLLNTPQVLDSVFYFEIAICYQALGRDEDVKRSIQHLKYNSKDPQFLVGLAKLYQAQGKDDQMWKMIHQLRRIGAYQMVRDSGLPLLQEQPNTKNNPSTTGEGADIDYLIQEARGTGARRPRKEKRPGQPNYRGEARQEHERHLDGVVRAIYDAMVALEDKKEDDTAAMEEWVTLATELFESFRNQRAFFPRDKGTKFTGFRWDNRHVNLPEDEEFVDPDQVEVEAPTEYRKIPFDNWLDVLLEYALTLAKMGDSNRCWDVLETAGRANVFVHEDDRVYAVRAVSLSCAIILEDDQKATEQARWYVRQHSFASEAWQLFSTINRFCRSKTGFFNSGPEQKFVMRQVKGMDYLLLDDKNRNTWLFTDGERVKWGEVDGPPKHDPALLALYGHMMFVAGTYTTALNYYFRAYTLRPEDPTLNLCIAISYTQWAYKRQSENRQMQIQQGLAFLFRYRELRTKSGKAVHEQEAAFNVGLMWHSLGLMHLALPEYDKVLELSPRVREEARAEKKAVVENFAPEAAFAMQTLLAIAGDMEGARKITEKWLVL